MDIVHFGKDGEMTPLLNNLYNFDHEAKSENLEVKEAVKAIQQNIEKRLKYLYDRGMDREILRDFIIGGGKDFILRLKRTTKLLYRGKELKVSDIAKKAPLFMELSATKVRKNKKVKRQYSCSAVKVKYQIGRQFYDLWLVVTRKKGDGYSFLLTRTGQESIIEVIKETFKGYGFRWKIEEYHRHIKDSYKLEDIQVKTFEGQQSMLAILTIIMSIIYRELASMHIRLLLESGVKTLNKERIYELYNFVYYKISKIFKVLLAYVKPKAFLSNITNSSNQLQLKLALS